MAIKISNSVARAEHSGPGLTLAEAIAASTRSVHAKLNKSIIARLPLALPPRAPDPSIYACGLLHIAPIYITFEALWQSILDAPPLAEPENTPPAESGLDPTVPKNDTGAQASSAQLQSSCERVHQMLQRLHLPGLLRSDRLKADIGALTGWPPHAVEEQLRAASQAGPLADFIAHIKESIQEKPHVLVAYAYIMYMALFAGGRFIRATLESAGQDFWQLAPSTIGNKVPSHGGDAFSGNEQSYEAQELPFCFLHFNTPVDGEDLKREFKRRLLVSEYAITAEEKADIVHASVAIFEQISTIVGQLDDICGEMGQHSPESEQPSPTLSDLIQSTLPTRLRDSVAVTRERHVRNRSSKKSSSDDDSAGTVIRRRGEDRSISSLSSHRSDAAIHDHPTIPAGAGIELCPAMASRSVRFDGTGSQKPQRRFSMAIESDTWHHISTGFSHYLMVTVATAVFVAAFLAFRSRMDAGLETNATQ